MSFENVSETYQVENAAIKQQTSPTIAALSLMPKCKLRYLNESVIGTTAPLTKFGTVVVTVLLMFVPNCSLAIVTKSAQ